MEIDSRDRFGVEGGGMRAIYGGSIGLFYGS